MHGIGAKIDADAERVFHEPEVFIASPTQGLKIGRDLQSDLQRFRWPPVGRCVVEVNRQRMGSRAAPSNSPAAENLISEKGGDFTPCGRPAVLMCTLSPKPSGSHCVTAI